jgi:hypothetical protein
VKLATPLPYFSFTFTCTCDGVECSTAFRIGVDLFREITEYRTDDVMAVVEFCACA